MTPKVLMSMGAFVAVVLFVGSVVAIPSSATVVVAFISGAVFGKGYGLWEERSK